MLTLDQRKWAEFYVYKFFKNISNSKAYHKDNLKTSFAGGIPYITRTNKNNGLETIVDNNINDYKPNSKNTISLGAENATFFFQPYDYITGNKMYVLESDMMDKYVDLFLQLTLNKSLKGCGFGFATGLTGTRAKNRKFLIPINK